MGYFIYKYVENGKIQYIGKTTDLSRRTKDHMKDKLANFQGEIYYFECSNKTAMDSWEYFLINKYHPTWNIALNDNNVVINIEEPKWELYKTQNIINIVYSRKPKPSRPKEKHEIEFRCSHCRKSFTTKKWSTTSKGYTTRCPFCPYAVWISKDSVQRQIEYKRLIAMVSA